MTFEIGPELAGVLEAFAYSAGLVGCMWSFCWAITRMQVRIRFKDSDE